MSRFSDPDILPNIEDLNGSVAAARGFEFAENNVEASTTNNIPTYQTHLSFQPNGGASIPAGDYLICWEFSVYHSATNNAWGVNVEANPGTISITPNPPTERAVVAGSGQSINRSGCRKITWPGGVMTITVGFARESAGTVSMKRSSVWIERVS